MSTFDNTERLGRHASLSQKLEALSDVELQRALEGLPQLHAGVGGRSRVLLLEGEAIFVKQIPLTELELRPEHFRSTANLFDIPFDCHYGMGGPGFSAWRELACNAIATDWVLSGECTNFPLLYHWRVLASKPGPLEGDVDFWLASPAVRARLEAISNASAQLVLFSEYVPQNLLTWLSGQLADRTSSAAAIAFVDEHLTRTINFMNAKGMIHFDAHFENILTDGVRLYFADFGLALSADFALTEEEVERMARHRSYDFDRTAVSYVHCVLTTFFGSARWKEKLHNYLANEESAQLAPPVAAVLQRQGPRAAAFLEFAAALRAKHKRPSTY